MKKLSIAAAGATIATLTAVSGASAATFGFSFSNEDGLVNGIVEGTIELPDGDGLFAATDVTITSFPNGLGLNAPINILASDFIENVFSVVAGEIDIANTSFLGLINDFTALSFSNSIFDGSTFLDALNGEDLGATGVRDADSSTLTFTSPSATTPEPGTILGLLAVGSLDALTRKRKA
ncbi:MAG: PEP-CTERM sorting domain-containing protein [Cyanobacteriota bacterium]|nr:PEP-CTERM sorting domain-containing protein [Cyanobacteriota bacterium]